MDNIINQWSWLHRSITPGVAGEQFLLDGSNVGLVACVDLDKGVACVQVISDFGLQNQAGAVVNVDFSMPEKAPLPPATSRSDI